MKKQYCMDWCTRKGNDGFKNLGYDLTIEQCEKELMRKLKQKTTESVYITWNWVGSDVPDGELGNEYPVMFGKVKTMEILGIKVYMNGEYEIREYEIREHEIRKEVLYW